MRLIERFRQKLQFHESEAAKYRNTIALIEQELNPHLRAMTRRKINGALAQHLQSRHGETLATAVPAGPAPAARGARRRRPSRRGAQPPGYQKHATGKMSIPDAITKALARGPLNQVDLAAKVDVLRGTPTNRNSLLVCCAKMANEHTLVRGKAGRGVYALPAHKGQIPAVEAKTKGSWSHPPAARPVKTPEAPKTPETTTS